MAARILVIDDHYREDLQVEDRLLTAVRAACPRETVTPDWIAWAHDVVEAERHLGTASLRVVLLDQVFDEEKCHHLERTTDPRQPFRIVNHRDALARDQGFLIAEFIAYRWESLRPAILMFTGQGEEVERSEDLRQQNVLDQYQGKPPVPYRAGEPAFDSLVDFLGRYLAPLDWARAQVPIDPAIERFLQRRGLDDWGRDAAVVLEALVDVAREYTGETLSPRTWTVAQERGLLPDLDAAWADDALWLRLLSPLGPCSTWEPWTQGSERSPHTRFRYFQLQGCRENVYRILAFLDPRFLPVLGPEQRERLLGRVRTVTGPDDLDPSKVPPQSLFRFPLPWAAPGGRLPWLLGVWYEVLARGEWIPLAEYRTQLLRNQQLLRPALREVFDAVRPLPGREAERERMTPGLLIDGVLINREEMHQRKPFQSWRTPFFPLDLLGLHPDPSDPGRPPEGYLRRPHRLGVWLDALSQWFAWGHLPLPQQAEKARERIAQLLEGQTIGIRIEDWWRDPHPEQGVRSYQEGRLRLTGRTLLFRNETRCCGAANSPRLRVSTEAALHDCTLQCQGAGTEVLPLFEQLIFERPVRLQDCRLVDEVGEPAPLRLRECTFRAGLDISGLAAAGVIFEDCTFAAPGSGDALRLVNLHRTGDVILSRLEANGRVRLNSGSGDSLRIQGTLASVELGPNLQIAGRVKLELQGPSAVVLKHLSANEELHVDCSPQVSLEMLHSKVGETQLRFQAGAGGLRAEAVIFGGRVFLTGPSDPSSADATAIPVRFDRCSMRGSLLPRGDLDLSVTGSRLAMGLLACGIRLRGLRLGDTTLKGALDLRQSHILGPFEVRGSIIEQFFRAEETHFQSFTVAGSNCLGNLLFARSHFHGPVCIAQPGETGQDPQRSDDLAGVVLREQVDFSEAIFDQRADLSHVVMEYEAKFQRAQFLGPADFAGLQASGNLIFADAVFRGPAVFDAMILEGVFDAHRAMFTQPPCFTSSSFARSVRLSRVCWPVVKGQPAADFRDCACAGLLDLSDPREVGGKPVAAASNFAVDLAGASADRLNLSFPSMCASLEGARRQLRHCRSEEVSQQRYRVMKLARLFEAALLREMRFQDADHFYREANNEKEGPRWRAWLLDRLWGHGTQPLRAFGWGLACAGGMLGLSALAGWQTGQGSGEVWGQVWEVFYKVSHGEGIDLKGLPGWFWGVAIGVGIVQAVLLNLFFAALARKLLR